MTGDTGGGPASGGEQEVAGPASGIDDGELQDFGRRIGGIAGLCRVEHRVERGGQQELHQAVGGIVAAGRLAFVSFVRGIAHGEGEVAGLQMHDGDKFEQAFVDRAEFLGLHIAPVHAGHGLSVGPEPGEMPDGLEQAAVGDPGPGQVGEVQRDEDSAERRQAETRLALGKGVEQRPQALPGIVVPIERGIPGAPLAQAAHGVAVPVGLSRGVRRIRGVQETTILGGEQEDQPVDEAQQFLVIGLPCQLAGYGAHRADRRLPGSRETPHRVR